ncbi:MAG TPA: extensin family protein [Polyangiaceae bacterium]|nr:extensin family protein [Polyangiaceae bacterium]
MTRLSPLALAALCAIALMSDVSEATSPYLVTLPPEDLAASAAHRYANLSNEEVIAELNRRALPFELSPPIDGVRTPVRLTGPLHGVHVHSVLPAEQRPFTKFEILDARLLLSLDDFCALLERHDIVEVVHYTMYRPNAPPPTETEVAKGTRRKGKKRSVGKLGKGKLGKGTVLGKGAADEPTGAKQKTTRKKGVKTSAKKGAKKGAATNKVVRDEKRAARRPTKEKPVNKLRWAPPGTRHPAGLAVDIGSFKKRDGRWLIVGHHFQGRLGAQTCGPAVEPPKTPEAQELWSIVCEAHALGLFTYVLTPNYDRAHADHFHMEIRGDVPWVLYH